VKKEPPDGDENLDRLRAKASEQGIEIARLREAAAESEVDHARLVAEARDLRRGELERSALVERLRTEARANDEALSDLRHKLAAAEIELTDLRAVRDALTPPSLPDRPGIDLAASFLPATEGVSGDFYLAAEGPEDATVLVVGDVVGKGLFAARRAAFVRTVFATTAPFSQDPAQLLRWANVALVERGDEAREFVTAGCVTFSPRGRVLRWAYAGHPAVLWLDTGEELAGGRTMPLGLSEDLACTTATRHLSPDAGVLLYTDGVTDARYHGALFGEDRLAETVRSLAAQPPSHIVAAVTTEVEQFADPDLADDLCVVAARIN
jgi:serine phosphatase RsbU (regulator of sigma subunit)